MKKAKVLDAFAILRWTQQQKGWERIKTLMQEAGKGHETLLVSQINLCEVYYKTIRIVGRQEARRFLDAFHLLPLTIIHPSDDIIWRAAEIKAECAISLANCFAAATAIEKKAIIVTGDPDFKKIEHLVPVEWI